MNLKNKHIVVTGGAGFIGSHLVDRLIKEYPEKITVLSNFLGGSKNNLHYARKDFENLRIINMDISDYKLVKEFFEGNNVDVVFNLAIIPIVASIEKPRWTFNNNVVMTSNICELARKDLFKTLIQFSSSEVYGTAQKIPMSEDHPMNPETPYAASKAATDHLVLSYYRTFKIDTSIVRPFNNYGPRQSTKTFVGLIPGTIMKAMKGEDLVIQGDGEQTRDYTFVTDTVEGAVRICKSENTRGKAINIATGKENSIKKIVEEIAKNLNFKGKIVHTEARPGDVRRHLADISLAKKLIDFEAKIRIEGGLRKTCDWYKKNLKI